MRSIVQYHYVAPNTEEMEKLQLFARSFGHEITPHPQINVYAHYRDDICFGYSEHVFIPTVYPAFHPGLTKPSDVLQVMNDWRSHTQLSGKAGYIGVPLAIAEGRANFPEGIMNKLGLYRMEREVFAVKQ